ncbi:fe(2+) transport protein 1-like [Elaeis guineensis]|uniref:Fe(2+) transport protein 1-like n=1 Tax=Elaeis guineensis var. tenera TaxID=51953 RepID=A0A6I9QH87_ELAGV|nr:fe(2+) transport protein 1-like [Elaeis guineensis]
MASTTFHTLILLLLLHSSSTLAAANAPESSSPSGCDTRSRGECYNRPEALRLKVIAIPTILVSSVIGVCLPLFSRSVPALRPDRNLFVVVKAFASGVILATGYMHVLPDSFDNLTSPCLPEKPWSEFPFTTFIAMVSAILTLMMDSLMLAFYNRQKKGGAAVVVDHESPMNAAVPVAHGHGHCGPPQLGKDEKEGEETALRRNRVIVQVLEMGIVVHSVVIGLSMGASQNPCTIRPLVAALCFHQMFEGMGLGGCILQAEYKMKMKAVLVFFFSTTTPFGVALGIALSNVYSDNSPTALIVVGILNACSAGLLNYTALVDLLAADFMGPKLQGNVKLQLAAYAAVLLGAGGMSFMSKWA